MNHLICLSYIVESFTFDEMFSTVQILYKDDATN